MFIELKNVTEFPTILPELLPMSHMILQLHTYQNERKRILEMGGEALM
jgi:hypothetical protein